MVSEKQMPEEEDAENEAEGERNEIFNRLKYL